MTLGDDKSAGQPICTAEGRPEGMRHIPVPHEIRRQYPRLIGAMRCAGLLTETEAIGALVDYKIFGIREGFGSEAVAHLGGPLAAIQFGITRRRYASVQK